MAMELRAATVADLDDLATIACRAMPMDPQWNYRFPKREQFPDEHFSCTRAGYATMLEETGVLINVMTLPVKDQNSGETVKRPIALAVWELEGHDPEQKDYSAIAAGTFCCGIPSISASISSTTLPLIRRLRSTLLPAGNDNKPNNDCTQRPDADPRRMKAFDDALIAAKKSYFDRVYGPNQLHLRILATHPDFQRRGAGSTLCRWGMQRATSARVPVTLFSSPMGQQLYSFLGFDYIGTVIVQVKGEDEKLSIGAMIYPYRTDGNK